MGSIACADMPLSLTEANLAAIRSNQTLSDTYQISAQVAGTDALTAFAAGYLVGGSTTNTLVAKGVPHTWNETRLFLNRGHQFVSNTTAIETACELYVYFKSDRNPTEFYCIVIPVATGTGVGNDYFAALGQIVRSKPVFSSLWQASTGFLEYVGKDIRDCNSNKKITYMVATQYAYIRPADLTRLRNGIPNLPTRVQAKVVDSERLKLLSFVPAIEKTGSAKKSVANGYVETAQVKCRPLDRTRDISGNIIYVGGKERKGDTTLDKELEKAADFSGGFEEPTATVQGSDLETILGIVLGVVIGIIVAAFVVVWVFRKTETNYLDTLKLYSSTGFTESSKVAETMWQKLTPEPCKKVVEKAVAAAAATATATTKVPV